MIEYSRGKVALANKIVDKTIDSIYEDSKDWKYESNWISETDAIYNIKMGIRVTNNYGYFKENKIVTDEALIVPLNIWSKWRLKRAYMDWVTDPENILRNA